MSKREFPERPIIGVGGVTIDGERVLLVKRDAEPLKGQWSVPGGALEVGETLKEGVERELFEETGVAVEAVSVVEILDRVLRLPNGRVKYHYVLIDYLCRLRGPAMEPIAGSDAGEARWISRADLANYELRPDMLAVIEKAFQAAL